MDCLIPDWLYIMADTAAMPDLQLHLKPPALNWDGNLHETFKSFRIRATVLLDGPYARYDDKDKVAALLSWMGDKGFHLYESIEWGDYNKELWNDVLKAFESHFKPCQTVMQSWYQLGSLYSSNCKDQTEFMTRIKELVNEGGFTQKDEVTKFLFVIHNMDPKVREYLIDKGDPKKTCSDFLNLARSVESMVQTETMSKQLLQNVGKLSISAVQNRTQASQRQRSSSRQSNKRADSQNRSSSGQRASSGRCGRNHAPRRCPAFRQNCRRCGVKGHYAKYCKTKNPNNQGRFSCKDTWEVSPEEHDNFEFEEDAMQIRFGRDSFRSQRHSSNIMFDEIEHTKALGDLLLSNKSGAKCTVRFKLDSGAGANLLPLHMYKKLFPDRRLRGTVDKRVQLIAANKTRIKQLGTVRLRVHVRNKEKVCLFYVVPDMCRPIFGLPDLTSMKLLSFDIPLESDWNSLDSLEHKVDSVNSNLTRQMLLSKYHDVFSGLGKLKVEPVKIHLREDAVPVRRPCRRVPIAIRKQFQEELDNLVTKGVLTKLDKNDVTEWLNSFVNVTKPNGELRVCLDPTGLNPHIIRPVCNSHTLDEVSYMLKDAKVFSVVDANKGFFQLPLHEDSKRLTAMLTPCGVYVYNVLAMGLSLASDVFESTIRDMIKGLKGVVNIADDLLVYGADDDEHDRNLIALLDRCHEIGLTLNPNKLRFKCKSVPFFGNVITDNGIKPDPSKVQAIKNWPVPTCLKDLQSFLGAVNFISKFIPQLSKLRSPLQGLCKKDIDFQWSDTHQEAFQVIKDAVCDDALLSYYDKNRPTFIEVDASGQGLGAVLLQGDISPEELRSCNQTEGNYLLIRDKLKPIAYASKSLSDAEKRYSNIERELLGVVWAIQHFHHFTFANKVNIISDHKPLHPLFTGKSLVSCSPRTARLLFKIIDRDVTFYYQNGPSMHVSDALSRLPSHNSENGNKQEVKGLNVTISDVSPVASNVTLTQFREATATDEALSLLKLYVMHGWPSTERDCAEMVQPYFTFKEEISFIDGMLFKGQRLIVPNALRYKTLQVLHRPHMGVTKTLARARTAFYWPGISVAIKDICLKCETCLKYSNKQMKESLGLVPSCTEAWDAVATDIFEFQGNSYLIVACRFSGYIVVRKVKDHTAKETIDTFASIFAEHGVPRTIHCDRGANYMSNNFSTFCKDMNTSLTYSSAEHHSSNYAERAVQTVKKLMQKSQGDHWEISLLEYLMTPIRLQGDKSPLKLMQSRTVRGILPVRKEESSPEDLQNLKDRRLEQKQYFDQGSRDLNTLREGQSIFYFDHRRNKWLPGVVTQRYHERAYQVVTEGGRPISRNRRDLKPHPGNVEVKFFPRSSPDPHNAPKPVQNVPKPMSNRVSEGGNKVSTEKPVSANISKNPEDQGSKNMTYVTRSGRAVKKPARFLDK